MKTNHLGRCLIKRRFKKEKEVKDNENSVTYNTNIQSFVESTNSKRIGGNISNRKKRNQNEEDIPEEIYISEEEKVKMMVEEKIDRIVNSYNIETPFPPRISSKHTKIKKLFNIIESKVFTLWKNNLSDKFIFERNIEIWRQYFIPVERSDIIVQIIDVRNVELLINWDAFEEFKLKRHLIFLNKCDLLGIEPGEYFPINNNHIITPQNLETVESSSKILPIVNNIEDLKKTLDKICTMGIQVFFINETCSVSDLLINHFKKGTFAFTGFPNAGKSSTINKIFDKKKVKVSKTPGKTKHLQSLYLTDDIIIIDTPGIVFPRPESLRIHLLLLGVLNIDSCDIKNLISHIIDSVGLNNLIDFYNIKGFVNDSRNELSCNFMNSFTIETFTDYGAAIKMIVKDFMDGKIIIKKKTTPEKDYSWYKDRNEEIRKNQEF